MARTPLVASILVFLAVIGGTGSAAEPLARIWRPFGPGFQPPEEVLLQESLAQKHDFGIAVAGGGLRGFAVAHGAVRALQSTGLFSKAKYLSTTSGSVWMGVPLYYQTLDSIESFLGESLSPAQLNLANLTGAEAGSMITRLPLMRSLIQTDSKQDSSRAFLMGALHKTLAGKDEAAKQQCLMKQTWCRCLVEELIPDLPTDELWTYIASAMFLEPFGLAEKGAVHCHESQLSRVREQLENRTKIYVARDMSREMPFLLTQSAAFSPLSGRGTNQPIITFPMEQNPLYTGFFRGFQGAEAWPYEAVGDLLLESWAWPSSAAGPSINGSIQVKLEQDPKNKGLLAQWVGIATDYLADFQQNSLLPICEVAAAEKLLPHAQMWSPLLVDETGTPKTKFIPVGDPGLYDDVGHLPLLRRQVQKLVIFDSAAIHDNVTGVEKINPCEMTYLRAAFGQPGCPPYANPAGQPSTHPLDGNMTVFEPSEFAPLWDAVLANVAAGEPTVYRGTFTVVENKFLSVKGGWQAEIVFVIVTPSKSWRSELPPETEMLLPSYFPNLLCNEPTSQFMLSAISQYSSWLTLNRVVSEVEAMLDAEGEVLVV